MYAICRAAKLSGGFSPEDSQSTHQAFTPLSLDPSNVLKFRQYAGMQSYCATLVRENSQHPYQLHHFLSQIAHQPAFISIFPVLHYSGMQSCQWWIGTRRLTASTPAPCTTLKGTPLLGWGEPSSPWGPRLWQTHRWHSSSSSLFAGCLSYHFVSAAQSKAAAFA